MTVIKYCFEVLSFCRYNTPFSSEQNKINGESELIKSNCPRLFATVGMMFSLMLRRDSDDNAVLHSIVSSAFTVYIKH